MNRIKRQCHSTLRLYTYVKKKKSLNKVIELKVTYKKKKSEKIHHFFFNGEKPLKSKQLVIFKGTHV